MLFLRARAIKTLRNRTKAAARAAKAAAEAAANAGDPDVIATNPTNTKIDDSPIKNLDTDTLTFAHQRAIAAVGTIIQVNESESMETTCVDIQFSNSYKFESFQ